MLEVLAFLVALRSTYTLIEQIDTPLVLLAYCLDRWLGPDFVSLEHLGVNCVSYYFSFVANYQNVCSHAWIAYL